MSNQENFISIEREEKIENEFLSIENCISENFGTLSLVQQQNLMMVIISLINSIRKEIESKIEKGNLTIDELNSLIIKATNKQISSRKIRNKLKKAKN